MTGDLAELAAPHLAGCRTLTLATSGGKTPAAAALFFASDADLNLYFISSASTRHVENLLANPEVAVTVNADADDWRAIQGLQIEGRAEPVEQADDARVRALYLAKFPEIASLLAAPADGDVDGKKVASKMGEARFYRIVPRKIRIIDNTRGFGHHDEFLASGERAPFRDTR